MRVLLELLRIVFLFIFGGALVWIVVGLFLMSIPYPASTNGWVCTGFYSCCTGIAGSFQDGTRGGGKRHCLEG
ncbi:hypothetical protein ACQ4XT_13175 [Halobacillus faecis]